MRAGLITPRATLTIGSNYFHYTLLPAYTLIAMEQHSSNGLHSTTNTLFPVFTLLTEEQLAGVVAGV